MQAAYPEDDGPEARQGTAAHWYVTEAVQGRVWPVGTITPNGVPIDEEMVECGESFIEHAATLGQPQFVERKLTMHETIHPANEGTPDLVYVDWGLHRVDVVDYKYGHRGVNPFRHEQLVNYLAGVFEADQLDRDVTKGWTINLTIVQPRNYNGSGPVRTWSTLGHIAWREIDKLREAAHAAYQSDALTKSGPWCRDCTARHACPALRATGEYVLDLAGESVPQELDDAAVGLMLAHIDQGQARLDALRSGLEAVAMGRIRSGRRVPGWGPKQGEGREAWTIPAAQVIALGENMGVTLAKEAIVTPGQARKAGLDPDLVAAFATKPPGPVKLVRVDDSTAARAFGVPPGHKGD